MPHNPTMVIGVGEAGCKIASDLYDDLESIYGDIEGEDFKDYFGFIGIDTREEDLDDFSRSGFTTINLDPPEGSFGNDQNEFPYLTEGLKLEPAGGATRQRSVSRYYLDNVQNFDQFYQQLETTISNFFNDTELQGQANIWVVNSFGGGTGSGAFPLLTAMINDISFNVDRQVWIGGIGSLPRLELLEQRSSPPDEDPKLYANAYAALRELSVLVGYDFDERDDGTFDFKNASGKQYPIEIPIHASVSQNTKGGYELDKPPFDFYGLMGIDEGKSDSFKRDMNRIAGNTILFFSEVRGIEDFASGLADDVDGNEILYSLSSASIEVPVDTLERYVAILENLSGIQDDQTDLRREINRNRINRDILNRLIDYEPGDGPSRAPGLGTSVIDPESGDSKTFRQLREEVDDDDDDDDDESLSMTVGVNVTEGWAQLTDIYESVQSHAENFPSEYDSEILEERLEQLTDGLVPLTSDLKVDSEPVAKYFYFQELLRSYREQRADHSFRQEMEEEWEAREPEIRENIDKLGANIHDVNELSEDGDPIERWEEVLKEFHKLRIKTAENELDNVPIYKPGRKSEIKQELKRRRQRREELQNGYVEYKNIVTAIDDLRPRRDTVEQHLDETRRDIETELREELGPRQQELNEREREKQTARQRKEEILGDYDPERFMSIPFNNFESVTPEVLTENGCITDLVENDIVKRRDIVRAIQHIQQNEITEQLQDRETNAVNANLKWFLGGLQPHGDTGILEGELDSDVEGKSVEESRSASQSSFYNFDDDFSIRLAGLCLNIKLENTSEFGTIHEMYSRGEQVSGEFGLNESNDDFLTSRFAYPELFDGYDDRIESYFGLHEAETTMD